MIKAIMLLTKFIIAVSIALLMNSCNIKADFGNGVDGNGKITTEVRNISNDFSSIDVNSGIEVIVSQSDDQFVSVETDSNLQKLITTKVENGVLIIEPTEPVNETQTIKVTVRMRKIEILEASSGSKIRSSGSFKGENISIDTSSAAEVDVNLKYDNITLDASSGSSINAKGIALILESSASSGAQIEANNLMVNNITADASSGAIIKVHPIVTLDGSASSGANVIYDNEPKSVKIDESSGGNVGHE